MSGVTESVVEQAALATEPGEFVGVPRIRVAS